MIGGERMLHEYECLACLTMHICKIQDCKDNCVKVCGECSRQIVKEMFDNGFKSVQDTGWVRLR